MRPDQIVGHLQPGDVVQWEGHGKKICVQLKAISRDRQYSFGPVGDFPESHVFLTQEELTVLFKYGRITKGPLAMGTMFPSDGVEGCTYRIDNEKSKLRITIMSPNTGEVLSASVLSPEEAMTWLLGHADY